LVYYKQQTGEFLNFTTDPIDGLTPTTGDKIFLKSGGGLTLTKPTGAENGIQNLGLIGKVSGGNAGSITVSSIMRTNDVPNLPTGKIWVGDGNTIVSDTVFLDEPNGRMGIGTTDPYAELYVKSPVAQSITNDIETTTAGFVINGSDENMSLQFGLGGAALNYGNWIQSGYDNGTPGSSPLFLNPIGGNVGIGTDDPNSKLQIKVGTDQNIGFNSHSSVARISSYNDAFTASSPLKINGSDLRFDISSVEKMRITSGGELIINGTTSAYGVSQGYPLHVKGTSSQGYVSICRGTQNSGSEGLIVGTDSSNAYLLSRDNIPLILGTNNLSHVFIKPNGNVGIGVTSPGAKLDIVGSTLGLRIKKADLSDVLRVYTQGSGIFMDNGNVHISDDLKIGATLLSNQENTDIDTGAEVVAQVAHATYTAAFFDFVVKKGTNVRSGTVYACHDGTNVEFTETSTNDLGDTSDVTLSVDISGANMRLLATVTSNDWSVKSLIRAI
jgi:hypothetical protein